MSKKKSVLPKVEVLIILIFFLSFIVWAFSKCNATKSDYKKELEEQAIIKESERVQDSIAAIQSSPALPNGVPSSSSTQNTITSTSSPTTPLATSTKYSKLFVVMDGLNMRTGPHLDSAVVMKLGLNEEVYFMNEVTDSTQQLNIGHTIADEPWIKVKYYTGHVGWVYGAGVNYYQRSKYD